MTREKTLSKHCARLPVGSSRSLAAQSDRREQGAVVVKEAALRVALVSPSPYRVAMSSLGYQAIYGILNALPGIAADRAMLPDEVTAFHRRSAKLVTLERHSLVGSYKVVAFSIAYELEVLGLLECLDLARIPLLAAERNESHPLVVAGGPLTFSNPAPIGPFCDVILLGEAEESVVELVTILAERSTDNRRELLEKLAFRPGFYVPAIHHDHVPAIRRADDCLLPARSVIVTPLAELSDMFLVEVVRGCSRGCAYCVMRRSTNGGMRVIAEERILDCIPPWARRVGLVGAAVTDHPRIASIVARLVESGRGVGISSLRPDRLTDELVDLLACGGYRTMTVALDGASERLRCQIDRNTREEDLIRAARLATAHRLGTLKVYVMVGLAGEADADIEELGRFALELARLHPRVALGISPFVPKRNTPLDGSEFAGVPIIRHRLALLRRLLAGRVEIRSTSVRQAWIEHSLARGTCEAGLAALEAWRNGGSFAAWKRAFCASTAPQR
ncbi:MAG: radical SAM protein [Pseudomonadota bacterium]